MSNGIVSAEYMRIWVSEKSETSIKNTIIVMKGAYNKYAVINCKKHSIYFMFKN